MADPITIALSAGVSLVSSVVGVATFSYWFGKSIATKADIDKVRDDQEKHEQKDDDRWDAQGNRSEDLAWTLGEIAGAMGLQRRDPRASRPK